MLADRLIAKLELEAHIDTSIVSEEAGAGRPSPRMIQELMRRSGVADSSCVLKCGDTARDMEEGRNAQCGAVIGVLSGADNEQTLIDAGADYVVPSVANIFCE